jgi:hypothetical protein
MTDQPPTAVQAQVRAQFDRQVAHYLQGSAMADQELLELMTLEQPHTKPSQTLLGQPHTGGTAGWHTPRRPSGWER